MFSYYGSKAKLARAYPTPRHDRVIEPFAGAAHYSLRHWKRDIWINDKYHVIAVIWRYIQQANDSDIESLPELQRGESLHNHRYLSRAEKYLLGFCVNMGAAEPHYVCTNWAHRTGAIAKTKAKILANKHKIQHWKITNLDYVDLPNDKATWFIDPPYQYGGDRYPQSDIWYAELASWCRRRTGQTIVCEHMKADWLPFEPLKCIQGQRHRQAEAIWYCHHND